MGDWFFIFPPVVAYVTHPTLKFHWSWYSPTLNVGLNRQFFNRNIDCWLHETQIAIHHCTWTSVSVKHWFLKMSDLWKFKSTHLFNLNRGTHVISATHAEKPHFGPRNTESRFLLVNTNEIEGKISTSPKVEFLPSISICWWIPAQAVLISHRIAKCRS